MLNVTGNVPTSDGQILKKLGYDLSTHAGESADWLNVLVAQAVSAYRAMILASSAAAQASALDSSDDEDADDQDDAVSGGRNVKRYVEHALNAARGAKEKQSSMVTLDYIRVTEFDFGQDFPVVSNARVRPSNESGKVVSIVWAMTEGGPADVPGAADRGRYRLYGSSLARHRDQGADQLS